ncbi:MAG: hypothetical protein GY778_18730 [bacterium]|nr:hypothetical protein [bacterium]
MRKTLRQRWLLKLAAVLAAGGSMFQTSGCNQTTESLIGGLATTVNDQYIAPYFNDQFNVAGSPS